MIDCSLKRMAANKIATFCLLINVSFITMANAKAERSAKAIKADIIKIDKNFPVKAILIFQNKQY